jgi:hypothetical protein
MIYIFLNRKQKRNMVVYIIYVMYLLRKEILQIIMENIYIVLV